MIYSVLRVCADGANNTAASQTLREIGFVGERKAQNLVKWGRPNHGERFAVDVRMHPTLKNAGTFEMFRQVDDKWNLLYTGRVTRFEPENLSGTRSLVGVGGPFRQITFVIPMESICDSLAEMPPKLFSKDEAGVISIGPDGVEVFEDEKVVRVKPSEVRRFVGQPRTEFNQSSLEELAQSILSIGQLKPVDLYLIPEDQRNGDGCKYEISYDGERRWRACDLAGCDLKGIVKSTPPGNEVERFAKSFVSNLHSSPHTPLEMVDSMIWLHDRVGDVAQMHAITGLSVPTIYGYLRVKRLNPVLKEKMAMSVPEDRRLRLDHARKLSDIKDPEEQVRIYEEAYSHSTKGAREVARHLNTLVSESGVERIRDRKRNKSRDASRAVQALISAVRQLGNNSDGFARHLLFITEDNRQEIEKALDQAKEILPKLISSVKVLAPTP